MFGLLIARGVDGASKPVSTPAVSQPISSEPDWILRDVSFAIEPGETVAIVGHTGAGKTTIISLLMRFYDVQKGAIRIDGVDIKDMDMADLRRRYGVVLQDPFLFTGTVEGNIRLGTSRIQDADIEKAAEDVNLADFIRTLPNGFKEYVHERGATLSTGQKQLISFARALAHNPKILILDEATSSVDTETEFRVRDALSRMVEGRTSVIIAHRLSTIQRADKIIVMHKGQVREVGNHQQLLAQHGIYYKLYQLQYKDQEIPASAVSRPEVTAKFIAKPPETTQPIYFAEPVLTSPARYPVRKKFRRMKMLAKMKKRWWTRKTLGVLLAKLILSGATDLAALTGPESKDATSNFPLCQRQPLILHAVTPGLCSFRELPVPLSHS